MVIGSRDETCGADLAFHEHLAGSAEALCPASRWTMARLSLFDLLLMHRILRVTGPEWTSSAP